MSILTLTEMQCCECLAEFAMERRVYDVRKSDGKNFFCPLGHPQHFTDTEFSRLQKENKRLRDNVFWTGKEKRNLEIEVAHVKQEKANIKRQLTITRKRVANGVCPCCHRTFQQLSRHMDSKHPDFKSVVS